MHPGAQRYLAERLTTARVRPDGVGVTGWRQQTLAGFGAAIEALLAAGAMDAEEAHDWNNRMFEALGLEPFDPLPPGTSGARSVFIGEGEPPPPPPVPPAVPVARFLELLPVRDADRPVPFGGRLQILGIERYDWQVAVAWRLAPRPDAERRYAAELRVHERDTDGLPEHDRMMLRHRFLRGLGSAPGRALALSDDVGTDYRSAGGGSSGGGDELTGRARFVPGIPPTATVLTVRWEELEFEVPLGDR